MMKRDKILHFAVGAGICLAFSFISPWAGVLAAASAGLAKELYDRTGRGHVEFLDFWWTGAGGFAAALLIEVLK